MSEFSSPKTYCCRLLIIVGVILLVGSRRLVRLLPSRSRRLMRSNADKSYGPGPRRSGSSIRESNPSAVIQAATLNHLLSSSKEKA